MTRTFAARVEVAAKQGRSVVVPVFKAATRIAELVDRMGSVRVMNRPPYMIHAEVGAQFQAL